MRNLESRIEKLYGEPDTAPLGHDSYDVLNDLVMGLESGDIRAAERDEDGAWHTVTWVKKGILLGFRAGRMVDMSVPLKKGGNRFSFVDKSSFPPREFDEKDGIRIVPGGSTIRRGAFVAKGVVCMPPMFVNVGAYVGFQTMIDSHALVGSCAQIGSRVHLSASAQIGGVLEPINANPVIIEDDVMVGGNCGVYEGTIVREGAVLGAGVVLTRATPVYDLVKERVLRGNAGRALEIPEGAVVVPGARAVTSGWGLDNTLSIQTPIIVKYRDEKTDVATALEEWLR